MGLKQIFGRKPPRENAEANAKSHQGTGGIPLSSPLASKNAESSPVPTSADDKGSSSSLANIRTDTPTPPAAAAAQLRNLHQNESKSSLASSLLQRGTTPPISRQNSRSAGGRIQILENGEHVHHLRNQRRQEKLGKMLRDIMGTGQKVGHDAVSAVPDFVSKHADHNSGLGGSEEVNANPHSLSLMQGLVRKVAKGEMNLEHINGSTMHNKRTTLPRAVGSLPLKGDTAQSLLQKYGRCQEVIGRGSYGVVRVSHKQEPNGKEQLYAVKEFKRRPRENEQVFQERFTSEFCISSALHHTNIITTFDLMRDAHGGCCQIMEYCSGGDLYSLVLSCGAGLTTVEADCFFKQILRGVVYMHSMGVAHCDLKPENILLTQDGVCKISDFGSGECFRMAWEEDIHYSKGVFGSGPYIAPEEFKHKPFDPRPVDIWALGIIYMVMRTGSYLWRTADPEQDEYYKQYLADRKTEKGYAPVEKLAPSKSTYVIYSILDPVPSRRITGKQVLNSEWGRLIRVCQAADVKRAPTSSSSAPINQESLGLTRLPKQN